MNPSVTVRSTPSESGTSLFILHEGRKVNVKDNSMKEWKEIHLEEGKVGWVPASAIEVISKVLIDFINFEKKDKQIICFIFFFA